jgi:hypothetical protein
MKKEEKNYRLTKCSHHRLTKCAFTINAREVAVFPRQQFFGRSEGQPKDDSDTLNRVTHSTLRIAQVVFHIHVPLGPLTVEDDTRRADPY